MAERGGIKIEGIDEMKKFLNALPPSLERRVTRQALQASAKPVIEKMRSNLNRHVRTGTLQKAIKAGSAKKGRRGKQEVVVLVGAHKARGTNFIRDGFYARFLERGTAKQPPRPWAGPALAASVAEQRRLLGVEFGKRALKEIKRQARKFIGIQ